MTLSTSQKVLLVEDSKSFAAVLCDLISKTHGFQVDVADDLQKVNQILQQEKDDYFVAIVDYHLPDAPNGEAIGVVVNNKIPTIVFTGKTGRSIEEDLWQTGIADYANKHGTYNLEYVTWMVKRIFLNQLVEVLIVDNSKAARNTISALLGRQNFVVHTAKSGQHAISIIKDNPNIRIAVIDCNTENTNGFQLATYIREHHSRAKLEVIGISSDRGRSLAAQFIKSGASDFILKPVIPEEFLCRVNNAVDRIEAYFELDKLNKVKNHFLGMAAHDIRGPLGSIKTASEFLLNRSPDPERTERLLNMIKSSSGNLIVLLETLLDISVIESDHPTLSTSNIDISDALQERIELYQFEAASKHIVIRQDIAPKISVKLDPLRIKQVFDNLITNGIKYSPHNSAITIKLKTHGKFVVMCLQDSGPGISTDEQKQLFKAFSVLSTEATGGEKKTGLGLAIAKSIVDAHNGRIYYQNTPEQHSTFFVELPLD